MSVSSRGVSCRNFSLNAVGAIAAVLAGTFAKLFKVPNSPTPGSKISDFTEADFPGYAPVEIVEWGNPGLDADGVAYISTEVISFTSTGGSPTNTAYGVWVEQPPTVYTDLVIGAVGHEAELTSAGNPFTGADVGKVLHVTGGVGFTVGDYTVLSVAGAVATMDGPVGTAASTGGDGELDPVAPDLAGAFAAGVAMILPGDACNCVIKLRADGVVQLQLLSDL